MSDTTETFQAKAGDRRSSANATGNAAGNFQLHRKLQVIQSRSHCRMELGGDTGPQKLTRPDGEIRAGRFDRRRGSGGRERRSGLLFGVSPVAFVGLFDY
jgi:hypothetical protein